MTTPKGERVISELSLWADDPREMVARVRQALPHHDRVVTSGTPA